MTWTTLGARWLLTALLVFAVGRGLSTPGAMLSRAPDSSIELNASSNDVQDEWRAPDEFAETADPPPPEGTFDGEYVRVYRICRVTAYCDRGITASGVQSGSGQCAAPIDIPFGSEVYIPSLGLQLRATDRTHTRFRRSTVDVFLPTKQDCRSFGRRFVEVEFRIPASRVARS